MTEPSEGAQRAAETIIACIAEGGIILARDVTDAMAAIIDRETHSAEMRKALEALPLDAFPEEQEYTIDGALFIGHSAQFFAAMILARRALKGGAA